MFYALLRRALRLALRVFYRSVEVAGEENVPPEGPLLLAANHGNSLVDAFLILAFTRRGVSFLAKSTLFTVPVFGWFLKRAGGIPAYRAMDVSRSEMKKNLDSLARCEEALGEGRAVAIFPEGLSHPDPELKEIKTGAARMVLGAEERKGGGLGVRIVPVGLVYSDRDAFRSRAFVGFGNPLEAAPFAERHRRAPRPAIGELTEAIEEALRGVTVSTESWEDFRAARLLASMLEAAQGGPDDFAARFARMRRIVETYERLRVGRPEEAARLRERILHYGRALAILGVRDAQVGLRYRAGGVAGFLARNIFFLLAGLPLAAAGAALNFVPYLLARLIGRRTRRPDVKASHKILAGMAGFPIWWALLAAASFALLPGPWWAALLVGAPLFGLFALSYIDDRRRFHEEARAFLAFLFRPGTRRRMEALRAEIIEEARKARMISRGWPSARGPREIIARIGGLGYRSM